ncbi:hypothetical protein V8F33_011371 [Rhypophila sp. PSN 637]
MDTTAVGKQEAYQSSSDFDFDSDEYDSDPEVTLESIQKSKTIVFSIRANYTNWAPREAFRELVQNWRDGIIKSFQLAERDFCVIREEKTSGRGTEIVYKVLRTDHDDEKEWLGYIRFTTKGGNNAGTVDLTNRAATLQPRHLDLGGTTKAGDSHQAGAHGEGLKLALLVLMRGRQNHSVRCRSGGFNWRFNFTTRGRLVCRLHRMSSQAIHKGEDQARRLSERTLLPFAAKPAGDVQFVIGETHKGRDEWGNSLRRSGVTRQEFDEWIKAALFLCDNVGDGAAIVSTEYGDLLTDPRLRGKIYLKGLLLGESTPTRSASITNRPLKFGYNFAHGRTNRERQSVAGAGEEAEAILAIWGRVLAAKPDMAAELSEMLNNPTPPTYADVMGAETSMGLEMATVLRDYLTGHPFSRKWYYSGDDKAKNPRLDHIIQGLGYEGAELTKVCWTILRRHSLLRTAEEEEQHRFTAAPLIANVDAGSTFATSVRHLLSACGYACPKTKGMAFRFVQAGQLHLDLFYSEAEKTFRVHDRWLSARGAVNELGLPENLPEADIVFHTVKRLFSDGLEQLPVDAFRAVEVNDARTTEWRRRLEISLSEQRLLSYLRLFGPSLDVVLDSGGLLVAWGWWPDARCDLDTVVKIQCHKASRCGHLRSKLLTADDAHTDNLACITPGDQNACRVYRANYRREQEARIDDLVDGEEYFVVLLTPEDPDSFVGISSIIRWTSPAPRSQGPNDLTAPKRITVEPEGFSSPQLHMPLPDFSSDSDISPEEGIDLTSGLALSPSAGSSLGSESNTGDISTMPEQEPANAESRPVASNPRPTSFMLGPRLDALDIFKVDRKRWYEARSNDDMRAVIGILSGEKILPEESRKRRRLDED